MENNYIRFLSKISEVLTKDVDISNLFSELKTLLAVYNVNNLRVYIFDSITNTIRDCTDNWAIIEEENEVYSAFKKIEQNDFIINGKAFKLPNITGDITLKIESLYLPIVKNEKISGLIELSFDKDSCKKTDFLHFIKIFASQLALKLQNILLNEQSKINVDFHDSMKNIAKIIETQYELNYIVPIIGEMLDRFISDHLIYVFLRQGDSFNLVWPKACKDERVYEILGQLSTETEYILTNNDKIGAFPLISENNELSGCIVARSTLDKLSKRDISYLEQLTRQSAITINRANSYSKILQYATIDALTNLNNRRQFEIRLGQEIASAKRQKNPLCAMMIDIDFFKKVNDTYGHASGDAILKSVASIIKSALRESDIPSRYGGEEFAVMLPYTHIDDALKVGERLRKAVEASPIQVNSDDNNVVSQKLINVTISMGLAEFDFNETGAELFEHADKALYEAKNTGRNKICLYKD